MGNSIIIIMKIGLMIAIIDCLATFRFHKLIVICRKMSSHIREEGDLMLILLPLFRSFLSTAPDF